MYYRYEGVNFRISRHLQARYDERVGDGRKISAREFVEAFIYGTIEGIDVCAQETGVNGYIKACDWKKYSNVTLTTLTYTKGTKAERESYAMYAGRKGYARNAHLTTEGQVILRRIYWAEVWA